MRKLFILIHLCPVILFYLTVTVSYSFGVQNTSSQDGTFWHVTDIHVDQNYSRTGDTSYLCHETSSQKYEDNGLYGNFLCDSPQYLVNYTIKAMREIESTPDFIIWTGDNLPHTRSELDPDYNIIFEAIHNITLLLKNTFPSVKIFPAIGNHDTFPANVIFPEYNNGSLYLDYLTRGGWNMFLPESVWSTFRIGGFYSHIIEPGLRIISLNTILWYEPNYLVANSTDPAGQLKWLKGELQNSSSFGEKVYIIGHVPPGYYNRVKPGKISDPMYHSQFLRSYFSIIKEHSKVILGQMFGHLHNDMFQLYQCDTGDTHSSALLASSVTPWHSVSPDSINVSLPVNPSVRLVHYKKNSGLLMNYQQYYLNLTQANQESSIEPKYELLYDFIDAYEVPDISTASLVLVYERLKSSPKVFQLFYKYLTAAKETIACDSFCKSAQLCSMACTTEEEYAFCMHKSNIIESYKTNVTETTTDLKNNSHAGTYSIIAVCVGTLVVIIIVVSYYQKNNRWCRGRSYQHFSDF